MQLRQNFFPAFCILSGNGMATRNNPAIRSGTSMKRLRTRACLNHFKRVLLGERHKPGSAQTNLVFKELAGIRPTSMLGSGRRARTDVDSVSALGMTIAERTWSAWFAKTASQPQSTQIAALDKVALQARLKVLRQSDGAPAQHPASFFYDLVYGGLVETMLSDNVSSHPGRVAHARMAGYQPRSPLHLHFDALELLNFRSPLPEMDGNDVVLLAGSRILSEIQRRWADWGYPGIVDSAYAEMGSKALREWLAWSPDEQETWMTEMGFSNFEEPREASFAHLLKTPDPELLGEEADVSIGHIYRLLFAIAADAEFLRDGRLLTWALDLATASAAAIAMCLAGSLDARPRREQVVLNALDALLFGELVNGEAPVSRANLWGGNVEEALRVAMNVVRADWSCSGTEMFYEARRAYVGEMAALGVSLADIRRVR